MFTRKKNKDYYTFLNNHFFSDYLYKNKENKKRLYKKAITNV